jgi:putative transposase
MIKEKVKKGYYCACKIHYHIVFPVKFRKAFCAEEVKKIIIETAAGIEERHAIEIEAIGCDKDHIHLLCSAHTEIVLGTIVRICKSITAREIFRRKPLIKKELWGGEFWTDGYYMGRVGERILPIGIP